MIPGIVGMFQSYPAVAPPAVTRQVLVAGFPAPVFVNLSTDADKQYQLPNGSYLNEQS